MEWFKKFLKEEDGVTAIEYALIAAVITLGILLSVQGVRTWITTQFNAVAAITP
jgi:pilus assembly protein Flp/PilA